LAIDSQTLWDQIERLARALEPAYRRVLPHVLSHAVIGADETRWRIMGKDGKPEGGSKWWQLWVAGCSDAVFYAIQDSRSANAAATLIGTYEGVVMCDGYTAYKALQKRGARYELAHCWAHVRREFLNCEKAFPAESAAAVEKIAALYRVEASCPTGPPGDEERRRVRQERSRPILEDFRTWMLATAAAVPPTSALRTALDYTSGHWSGLVRFVEDPRIPLDNNASERALRGPVVGRKNHCGSKSRRGTEVAALFYTLLESAALAGVEPATYLRAATAAALRGETIPLPHEIAASADQP
jgi:hypothetical protein